MNGAGPPPGEREVPIEVCVLASGSDGNATYIRSGSTAILIDAGLSLKELSRRLSLIDVEPRSLDAVAITHEHIDHVRGIGPLSRRHRVPVFTNDATARASTLRAQCADTLERFTTGSPFEVGRLRLRPFPVPHDAAETVGFTVSDGRVNVGVATDLGSVTLEVRDGLSNCDALVLESNHDESMLMEGPYPPFLKERVSGPHGHLSNAAAGALIESVFHGGLRYLVLAHISRINNVPSLTVKTARRALGRSGSDVLVSVGRHDMIGEIITM
ncbi:MAG: MBL fold metallo-hydrolase [Actinobacteria bacterium]|nr:MBL fold metallo-hydrolase [Actinomycetota bacterium]